MTDLDARVAALMRLINEYAGHRIGVETMPGHIELDTFERAQDKAQSVETELEQAIRAELQKPELHEPVTDAEVITAIQCAQEANSRFPGNIKPMQAALESFLQGRAKPAQETIPAELENYSRFLDAQMAEIAQEEITDAERCALICEEVAKQFGDVAEGPFVTDFGKHTHQSMAAGAMNCAAVIRASKGEKT